ncbi:unnamed protein product [Cylicocyclus nassatus]|uniref:Uncharacterized protein n=1 Tax=Cylicocyclus nassatus TaxID=53992 RepID=A0AA36GSF7_CYLNA|nr:unnamed protein product [Cylicocyclus nassatus]
MEKSLRTSEYIDMTYKYELSVGRGGGQANESNDNEFVKRCSQEGDIAEDGNLKQRQHSSGGRGIRMENLGIDTRKMCLRKTKKSMMGKNTITAVDQNPGSKFHLVLNERF